MGRKADEANFLFTTVGTVGHNSFGGRRTLTPNLFLIYGFNPKPLKRDYNRAGYNLDGFVVRIEDGFFTTIGTVELPTLPTLHVRDRFVYGTGQ